MHSGNNGGLHQMPCLRHHTSASAHTTRVHMVTVHKSSAHGYSPQIECTWLQYTNRVHIVAGRTFGVVVGKSRTVLGPLDRLKMSSFAL